MCKGNRIPVRFQQRFSFSLHLHGEENIDMKKGSKQPKQRLKQGKMLLILSFLLLAQLHVNSQERRSLVIKTIDSLSHENLPSVTIEIKEPAAQYITNRSGIVVIQLPNGKYLLKVSMIGYRPKSMEASINGPMTDTFKIELSPVSKTLQEVTITERSKAVEVREGKFIYNIEKSPSAAGNNAFDLLKRTPGIRIDQDDNIMLKGDKNVNVMIDGKQTYLSSSQLSALLRGMPAEGLQRIEVITTPSSQYDASGNAGIINIVTRKSIQPGYALNVGATIGTGRYIQTGQNIIGNYRVKKANFFASYNYGLRKGYYDRSSYRILNNAGSEVIYDRRSYDPSRSSNHLYKLGADLQISKNTTIGFAYNGFSNHWSRKSAGPTYIKSASGKIDSIAQNRNLTDEPATSNSLNLNFLTKFDSTGKQLSIDADYSRYNGNSSGSLGNQIVTPSGTVLQPDQLLLFRQPSIITIRTAKADLTLPYKTFKILGGAKFAYVTSDNDFRYDSLVGNELKYAPSLSNHFIYDEKVYAAYLSITKSVGKDKEWSAGIRVEHTASVAQSLTLNTVTSRNYTNLFPFLSFTTGLAKSNQWTGSISRRINRPVYNNLNPFRFFFDKYSYSEGNPYLRPELSWNLSLTYTVAKKYTFTLSYNRTEDAMLSIGRQDEATGIMAVSTYNFSHKNLYDFFTTVPITISNKWSMQNTAEVSLLNYAYQIPGKDIFQAQALSVGLMNVQTITLPWNSSFELTTQYISPALSGMYRLRRFFGISGGWKKSFANKRGDLRLSFSDIFKTDRYWGYSVYKAVNVSYDHNTDSRRIILGISWKIGAKLNVRKTSKLEEQDRIQ